MKKTLFACLALLVLGAAPTAALAKCPPARAHARPHHHRALAWRPHRHVRHRVRWRVRRPGKAHLVGAAANPANPPLYLGDLYIQGVNAPLWSKPISGAQVLARLPKRTTVTNMGRIAALNAAGKVVAYYYKVEAPNGKVGFVNSKQLSPNPPSW